MILNATITLRLNSDPETKKAWESLIQSNTLNERLEEMIHIDSRLGVDQIEMEVLAIIGDDEE